MSEAAGRDEELLRGRLTEVCSLMERLHRHKDRSYGDAWRKRGEVLSIFCNIARKQDRLEVAENEFAPSAAEPLADTIADLCVYAGKYLTWLAEREPEAFADESRIDSAAAFAADRGPDALASVLQQLLVREGKLAPSPEDARERSNSAFRALETGLVAQAGGAGEPLPPEQKVLHAWGLAGANAWRLTLLAEADPSQLDALRLEVEQMDQRAAP
jgi:hypothetical protein